MAQVREDLFISSSSSDDELEDVPSLLQSVPPARPEGGAVSSSTVGAGHSPGGSKGGLVITIDNGPDAATLKREEEELKFYRRQRLDVQRAVHRMHVLALFSSLEWHSAWCNDAELGCRLLSLVPAVRLGAGCPPSALGWTNVLYRATITRQAIFGF